MSGPKGRLAPAGGHESGRPSQDGRPCCLAAKGPVKPGAPERVVKRKNGRSLADEEAKRAAKKARVEEATSLTAATMSAARPELAAVQSPVATDGQESGQFMSANDITEQALNEQQNARLTVCGADRAG